LDTKVPINFDLFIDFDCFISFHSSLDKHCTLKGIDLATQSGRLFVVLFSHGSIVRDFEILA
jgi:hypothetical protein